MGGDAKGLPSNLPQLVHLRSWCEGALLCDGSPAGAAFATAQHHAFTFLLIDGPRYSLRGACAIVENPAVFGRIDHLGIPIDLVIYGAGRVSKRLLQWLGEMKTDFKLLHLPDYDPVGLSEFERLRASLGTRVTLHVPTDLAERFRRYSNRALLQNSKSRGLLERLRKSSDASVRTVVRLIENENAGLEQEALFLSI